MSGTNGPVTIDGSIGEGGGQVVRTACALSSITGVPCRVFNIRKDRTKTGLRVQHLAGLRALAALCEGRLEGGNVGSEEIYFTPAAIKPKTLNVEIETAGSITLVLQTVLLPSFFAPGPVNVVFRGGATDTSFSPTIDYHRFVFLKLLKRVGLSSTVEVLRRGFYPKGGAVLKAGALPGRPKSWSCTERGSISGISIISGASESLKKARVGERQAEAAEKVLTEQLDLPCVKQVDYAHARSPGSHITIVAASRNTVLGADGLGERGKRAEMVGEEAAQKLLKEIRLGACLDVHAADQLLPYLALAEGSSTVAVSGVSEHTKTNIFVIKQFLNRDFQVTQTDLGAIITVV
ncbi:MAG: RNA 3'-terminal phosphate cyclase [Thermodesulfobacteriota bacterium]